jgi:hypothetical protein
MLRTTVYMYIIVVRLSYVVYVTTRRPQPNVLDLVYHAMSKPLYSPPNSANLSPQSVHPSSSPCMCNMKLIGINPPMQRLSKKSKHLIEYKHGKHK